MNWPMTCAKFVAVREFEFQHGVAAGGEAVGLAVAGDAQHCVLGLGLVRDVECHEVVQHVPAGAEHESVQGAVLDAGDDVVDVEVVSDGVVGDGRPADRGRRGGHAGVPARRGQSPRSRVCRGHATA